MLLAPSSALNPYSSAATIVANLANEVKARRQARNLTVAQAATQIGVTVTTLTGLEAGTTNPTRTTIVAVLRWLAK